jgi:hypothetical protein
MKFELVLKLLIAAVIAIVVFGCTQQSTNDPSLSMAGAAGAMAAYFPSAQGWTSVFDVSSSGSSAELTFYVGGQTVVQGQTAYRWVIIPSQGTPDTNYVVVGPTSVLVYQDTLSTTSAEHLLQAPLTAGSSWYRYPELVDATQDTLSILTDINGGKMDTTVPGPGVRKLLPVDGGNELTVEAVEELSTMYNRHFSGVVKISNTDRNGSINSYWFAPGVGLVKYVIGATTQNPDGVTVGEIADYGLR